MTGRARRGVSEACGEKSVVLCCDGDRSAHHIRRYFDLVSKVRGFRQTRSTAKCNGGQTGRIRTTCWTSSCGKWTKVDGGGGSEIKMEVHDWYTEEGGPMGGETGFFERERSRLIADISKVSVLWTVWLQRDADSCAYLVHVECVGRRIDCGQYQSAQSKDRRIDQCR